MGLFDNLFDFNGDGELDSFEKGMEFASFMSCLQLSKEQELTDAGLDIYELRNMDYYTRREKIRSAGLDPDDYDF